MVIVCICCFLMQYSLLACLFFGNLWSEQLGVLVVCSFTFVTVLGYPPLSHPVAWQWSWSPTGLGYWCYASTYPLKCIANGGPQDSHLNPASNGALAPAWVPCMHAPPTFSIKAVHVAPWGSLLLAVGWVTSKTATLVVGTAEQLMQVNKEYY